MSNYIFIMIYGYKVRNSGFFLSTDTIYPLFSHVGLPSYMAKNIYFYLVKAAY